MVCAAPHGADSYNHTKRGRNERMSELSDEACIKQTCQLVKEGDEKREECRETRSEREGASVHSNRPPVIAFNSFPSF
ncbi:unnamed protein product [Hymenolepis diminuta]|uniref:Uncharacterized protein n=1 Tax=Hymenolepis diminuta TaxID=6216 RepID=A0A0R3SLF3_HYMDI|nr:unnamed protein product [Hymenolepis diminuta]